MVKVNKKSLTRYKRSRSKYTKKYKKRTKRRYSKRRYSKRRMKGGARDADTAEDADLAAAIAASLESETKRQVARDADIAAGIAASEVAAAADLAAAEVATASARDAEMAAGIAASEVAAEADLAERKEMEKAMSEGGEARGQGKANGEILELVREYGSRLYDGGHITIDGAYDYIDTIYKQLLKAPGNILDNTKRSLNKILGGTGEKGEGVIDASSSEAMRYAVSKVGTFDNDPDAVVYKRSGGNYKHENVQGDGACLFRAILLSELDEEYRSLPEIEGKDGRWANSFALRDQSIEWNFKNWDRDSDIRRVIPVTHQIELDKVKMSSSKELDDKEAYRIALKQQHIFGDEPEIRAACNVIGKPIIVYRSYEPDKRPKVYTPLPESLPNSTGRRGNNVVRILHIPGHYLAILPE